MDEIFFKVVFDGTLTGEFDLETTKQQFAKLFKLDSKRVDSLFSGKEFVIKHRVRESVAIKYLIRLADVGCECYMQEIIEVDEEEMPENERRTSRERRMHFRRGPRPGELMQDRRRVIRRKDDRRSYLSLKRRTRELPSALRAYGDEAAQN